MGGKEHCFELLGFDFMVDTNFNPWLLEVNTSPSMDYSTTITKRLVPQVLEDTLKVVFKDGPADNPTGMFELLHTGPLWTFDRARASSFAACGPSIIGHRICPPVMQLHRKLWDSQPEKLLTWLPYEG